jgi:hypothetical protein
MFILLFLFLFVAIGAGIYLYGRWSATFATIDQGAVVSQGALSTSATIPLLDDSRVLTALCVADTQRHIALNNLFKMS